MRECIKKKEDTKVLGNITQPKETWRKYLEHSEGRFPGWLLSTKCGEQPVQNEAAQKVFRLHVFRNVNFIRGEEGCQAFPAYSAVIMEKFVHT